MIYQYVSVQEVIGRVLRNVRLTDTGVISDIPVWVGHGMELLETSSQLEEDSKTVKVKFFQAPLPCGLVELNAVELNGRRLTMDISNASSFTRRTLSGIPEAIQHNIKVVDPFIERLDPLDIKINKPIKELSTKYFLKPGFICLTDLKDCELVLYYKRHSVDEDGFPMIPDNGNYKEALYWFVRGKLIGAGVLEETRTINEHTCNEKFEQLGGRAINEITYPSVDKMERIRSNSVSFSLPKNFWANFNSVT